MSEWISVNESMPSHDMFGKEVICCHAHQFGGDVFIAVWGKHKFLECHQGLECSIRPTHWMPLPEAPAGDNK